MRRWRISTVGCLSGAICAACFLLTALLLGAPWAHAAAAPAASGPTGSSDVSERVARARALLDTPQGATLLDLLGDPAVRQRLNAAPDAPVPPAAMRGSV